jgi:hypothetical protein
LIFRVALTVFASVLAVTSLWILLPEPARSPVHQLPMDREAAAAAAAARTRAERAARFGAMRGDLWSEAAYAYAAPLWSGAESAGDPNEGRTVVERALAYAPHDAAVWLLASGLASRLGWQNADFAAMLKTSYYTGPSESALLPLRLLVATRPGALSDADIQGFVHRDVRMILTRWPELKSALIAAYRAADPGTKRFLEGATADTDAAFVQTMRSSARP